MTKTEFAIQFDRLATIFPTEMTVEKATEYYASLSGFSLERITRAVDYLIRNHSGYFPQPAQIIKAVNDSFVPVYNNMQIEYEMVEISDEEKRYRKIFVTYYCYLIMSGVNGTVDGFKKYLKTGKFKHTHKDVVESEAIRLIDKYCDPAVFNFGRAKND